MELFPEKKKVMRETYIQTAYFDRIIEKSNTRLMIMSGAQYELKRRIEGDNVRSQSGLELIELSAFMCVDKFCKII